MELRIRDFFPETNPKQRFRAPSKKTLDKETGQ
jgi:hypothetical protein